ncbi:MAG: Cache 3/Cache 2 fusion domain-containing protein, partial [Rhodocyclaceae bacterium]|nr:Cache 3/Cache 2 fusion domain-containing protein [Rhodocyclaceae bacterium]
MPFRTLRARFLLPLTAIVVAGVCGGSLILAQRETTATLTAVEADARTRAGEVARLLSATDSLVGNQVKSSLKLLRHEAGLKGKPALGAEVTVGTRQVPDLLLGAESQAGRYELVDGVTAIAGGTATLFVASGNDFVRLSTN